jgi:2-dehydro-3-deoxyphosphooctonate aldolase (KDO 8-P synthase)
MGTDSVKVGPLIQQGGTKPFVIAGPCVIESEKHCLKMAERLAAIFERAGVKLIFKASYDKANRTSSRSFRGPGLEEGLRILEKTRRASGLPVLSDVHETGQVSAAAEVLDVLQIPAFLCRQTDLVHAAAATGRWVNIKKGQFLSPWEMRHVLDKALETKNRKILLTERGTFFGYNNLIVDFRSFFIMREFGQPIVFDATHSVQSPGGQGDRSGGNAAFIPHLARAAAAAGVDGFFFEVHDQPENALSDGPNALRLNLLPGLLDDLLRIRAALRERS